MKNRAKCKKCESIIESFHDLDYVECKCGAISVSGGSAMYCAAIDWADFVRVDDNDNEVVIKIKGDDVQPLYKEGKPNKEELITYLDEMIKRYETLPDTAKASFVTGYDFESLMVLLSAILKAG